MHRGIRVRNSDKGGRGVFATKPFRRGETIEVCPILVGRASHFGGATRDYVFDIGDGKRGLALGYGSLYNHSDTPNASHIQVAEHVISFKAARDIRPGEEIFVHYGRSWWENREWKPL